MLDQYLKEWGIELTDLQNNQFEQYYEMLVEWNKVMNLTAITEYQEVVKKHFVDSLSLVRAYDMEKKGKLIDVGTGAGFPGIPLKIAFPDWNIILLDSLNKRIKFLDAVIDELGLKNITTIHGRAEDIARDKLHREAYDVCVSRAVANLTTLSEYCLPFVKKGGCFVSYKSEKLEEELKASGKALAILGGKVESQTDFHLPQTKIYRNLLTIRKMKETPGKYPRKAGLPSKEPLS